MEAVEKKIKGFLGAALGTTSAMIVLGLIFFFAPGFMISAMRAVISIGLIAAGILMIARDMQSGRMFSLFSTSLLGIFFVIMGMIVAIYPETLSIITIALGVYMILNSVMQLNLASNIRGTKAYNTALFSNIIGLICGVLMIIHPGETEEAMVMIIGVVLMVYGVSGLVDTFILRSKIKDVSDNFKSAKKKAKTLLEDAKEAEVVEDKKDK